MSDTTSHWTHHLSNFETAWILQGIARPSVATWESESAGRGESANTRSRPDAPQDPTMFREDGELSLSNHSST